MKSDVRPQGLADSVRQDGSERRRGEHQGERGIGAEDDGHETAENGPSEDGRQGVPNPAESAARTTMVFGQRAETPWTGGHLEGLSDRIGQG
jgi:hypothetical protein